MFEAEICEFNNLIQHLTIHTSALMSRYNIENQPPLNPKKRVTIITQPRPLNRLNPSESLSKLNPATTWKQPSNRVRRESMYLKHIARSLTQGKLVDRGGLQRASSSNTFTNLRTTMSQSHNGSDPTRHHKSISISLHQIKRQSS
eukprot:UN30953